MGKATDAARAAGATTHADVRPQGDGGSWVVPVIVGAIVLCAFLCDGGDDAPDVVPGPVCNGGGEGC